MEDFDLKEFEAISQGWYDGYVLGECKIYNLWSILYYVHKIIHEHNCTPESFWANTSSNDLVYRCIRAGSEEMRQEFGTISTGGTI